MSVGFFTTLLFIAFVAMSLVSLEFQMQTRRPRSGTRNLRR